MSLLFCSPSSSDSSHGRDGCRHQAWGPSRRLRGSSGGRARCGLRSGPRYVGRARAGILAPNVILKQLIRSSSRYRYGTENWNYDTMITLSRWYEYRRFRGYRISANVRLCLASTYGQQTSRSSQLPKNIILDLVLWYAVAAPFAILSTTYQS